MSSVLPVVVSDPSAEGLFCSDKSCQSHQDKAVSKENHRKKTVRVKVILHATKDGNRGA